MREGAARERVHRAGTGEAVQDQSREDSGTRASSWHAVGDITSERGGFMQRIVFGSLAVVFVLAQSATFSQGPNDVATIVSAEEIQKVVSAPGGGDREIKIVDLGKFNLGIAVLRRGAIKAGTPMSGINHTKVTEAYYVVSGSGTLITGGEVENVRALAATNELVTTVVGPGNNATFK